MFMDYLGFGQLKKEVYILFIIRIIHSIGNFVFPFLTLYYTQKLDFSETITGFLVAFSAIFQALGSIVGGRLSDKLGRRTVLISFPLLYALCYLAIPWVSTPEIITGILFVAMFFVGGTFPAINATITDLTHVTERKKAYALMYLGFNIGFSISPIIAGILFYRSVFLLFTGDAVTTLISVCLVYFLIPETHPFAKLKKKERLQNHSLFRLIRESPLLIWFFFLFFLQATVFSQVFFTLPLYMTSIFGKTGPEKYGILMTANGLTIIIFTSLIAHITRNIHHLINIVISSAIYAVGFFLFFFRMPVWSYFLITVFWTFGEILSATNINSYIALKSPVPLRGRLHSLTVSLRLAGRTAGTLLSGFYIDHFRISDIWIIFSLISIIVSIMMLMLWKKEDQNRNLSPPVI